MNYLVLELHKQEPWSWVSNHYHFIIGVNAWSKYNCRSQSENPPRRTLLGIELKKYINKSLTRILWTDNDDIGLCKIWRNDGKSPGLNLIQSETKDDHQQSKK